MATTQEWIVYEKSGRWTAALRAAQTRQGSAYPHPRLRETRSLGEFTEQLSNSTCHLALVEIRPDSLNEILQLLTRGISSYRLRFAALLDLPPIQRDPEGDTHEVRLFSLTNLLWEIGVVEILDSPRQIDRLIDLHTQISVHANEDTRNSNDSPAFADWAWSSLPWQRA